MTTRETTSERLQPLLAVIGTLNTGQCVPFFTEHAAFTFADPALRRAARRSAVAAFFSSETSASRTDL